MSNSISKEASASGEDVPVSDELEALIKSLRRNRPAHNAKVLEAAIVVTKDKEQNHPKYGEILNFLQGKLSEQLAIATEDLGKKLEHLENAKKYLSGEDAKKIEGLSIQARMQIFMDQKEEIGDPAKIAQQLGNFSEAFVRAGHKRDASFARVLQCMFEAGRLFRTSRPEALASIEEAEKICREEGLEDGAYKMRSFRYSLEARYQKTPQEALVLMQNSLEEIEKTKDKHSKERTLADIHYLKGIISSNIDEKIKHFLKAGEYYLADDFNNSGYESVARAHRIAVHQPGIPIEKVQQHQKKSAAAYEKAGMKEMAHNMRGGYYGTLAIKRGLFDGKGKYFMKYSLEAIREFEKAGNFQEMDFLVGNIALMIAKGKNDQARVEHLEFAARALNKSRKGTGEFANYQLFLTKAGIEMDPGKRHEYRVKALGALENFIKYIEEEVSLRFVDKRGQKWKEEQGFLNLNLKADAHQLRATLATDPTQRKQEYGKAVELLEEICSKYPNQLMAARFQLGMLYIEMEEFDKAIQEFERAKEIGPSDKQVEQALGYARNLLAKGFRELKKEREMKSAFTALHMLGVGQVPTHIVGFVPRVLNIITERGRTFERAPITYVQKKETELRDEILQDLNLAFVGDATSESLIGNGKTDIRIKNPISPNDEAIGECKWWSGQKAYLEAKEQLLGYLPPTQSYGLILTFCNRADFKAVYEEAKHATEAMGDYVSGSIRETEIFGGKRIMFISKHLSKKGGDVFLYHLFFNLYPGK